MTYVRANFKQTIEPKMVKYPFKACMGLFILALYFDAFALWMHPH